MVVLNGGIRNDPSFLVLLDVHFRFLIVLEYQLSKWLATRIVHNCVARGQV